MKKQKTKICIDGANIEVSMETIERNYDFAKTYRVARKKDIIAGYIDYENLDEYVELLKNGKCYFNINLGCIYPALVFEEGEKSCQKVKDFCAENNYEYSVAHIIIMGNLFPALLIKDGEVIYNKIIHFCMDERIHISVATITE